MYLFLIMIKNIACLGHTGLLIIVWALWPLNIVTIHYLQWGFKTWGVTSPPPYFGIVLSARDQNLKFIQKFAGILPAWHLHAPR